MLFELITWANKATINFWMGLRSYILDPWAHRPNDDHGTQLGPSSPRAHKAQADKRRAGGGGRTTDGGRRADSGRRSHRNNNMAQDHTRQTDPGVPYGPLNLAEVSLILCYGSTPYTLCQLFGPGHGPRPLTHQN